MQATGQLEYVHRFTPTAWSVWSSGMAVGCPMGGILQHAWFAIGKSKRPAICYDDCGENDSLGYRPTLFVLNFEEH